MNNSDTQKTMDLVTFLKEYNPYLTLSGISKLSGVNKDQLSQYVQGYRKPSPKTTKKIEVALHNLANELQQIQFV